MEETGVLPYPRRTTLQMACVGRLNAKVKGQANLLQCLAKKRMAASSMAFEHIWKRQ